MNPTGKPQYVVLMAVDKPLTRDEFVKKLNSFYQNPLSKTKIIYINNKMNDDFKRVPEINLLEDKFPVEVLKKYRDDFFMTKGKDVVHVVSMDADEKTALAHIAEAEASGATIQAAPPEAAPTQPSASSSSSSSSSTSSAQESAAPKTGSWWLEVVNAVVKTVSPYLSTNIRAYLPGEGKGFNNEDEMVAYVVAAKKKMGIEEQGQNTEGSTEVPKDQNVEEKK